MQNSEKPLSPISILFPLSVDWYNYRETEPVIKPVRKRKKGEKSDGADRVFSTVAHEGSRAWNFTVDQDVSH